MSFIYNIFLIRVNYLTNLTYFPIFLYFVDFFKISAASVLVAAQLAAEPQPQIELRSVPRAFGHCAPLRTVLRTKGSMFFFARADRLQTTALRAVRQT